MSFCPRACFSSEKAEKSGEPLLDLCCSEPSGEASLEGGVSLEGFSSPSIAEVVSADSWPQSFFLRID
jgi:hypothetical protein